MKKAEGKVFQVEKMSMREHTTVWDPKTEDLQYGCTVPQFLHYYIVRKDISRKELAKCVGMDSSIVSRLMTMEKASKEGRLPTVLRFCKAFDIPLIELDKINVGQVQPRIFVGESPVASAIRKEGSGEKALPMGAAII